MLKYFLPFLAGLLFVPSTFARKLPFDSELSIALLSSITNNCSIVQATPHDTLGWKPADRACKTAVKSWKRYVKHPSLPHLRSMAEDGLELVATVSVLELDQYDGETGDQTQLDMDFDRFTFERQ